MADRVQTSEITNSADIHNDCSAKELISLIKVTKKLREQSFFKLSEEAVE